MNVCNIKNSELKALVKSALRSSDAIIEDLEHAMFYAETDDELIKEWIIDLQNLQHEINGISEMAKWVAGDEYQDLNRNTVHYLEEINKIVL